MKTYEEVVREYIGTYSKLVTVEQDARDLYEQGYVTFEKYTEATRAIKRCMDLLIPMDKNPFRFDKQY